MREADGPLAPVVDIETLRRNRRRRSFLAACRREIRGMCWVYGIDLDPVVRRWARVAGLNPSARLEDFPAGVTVEMLVWMRDISRRHARYLMTEGYGR